MLAQKVSAITEVKKANNLFKIFTACYFGIPLIIILIYMFIISNVNFYIPNVFVIIFIFYVIVFFIASIYFSKPYRRYYKNYVEEIEKMQSQIDKLISF
jgi:ABC-type multidrug transport system fused ATPase/permease subunit